MASSSEEFTYKSYRLDPKSPNFQFLAGKYAAISLQALSTDPGSFGVAYSTESTLGASEYAIRLSRPNIDVFICVAHAASLASELHDIEHGHWIGMVTQVGPTPKEVFWLRDSGAPEPLDDELETKWHHTGLWVDPAHRRKGISSQLIKAALEHAAKTLTGTVQQTRFRLFAAPGNEGSPGLYGSLGFTHVGKCTIPEAMAGNGNATYPFRGIEKWSEEELQRREGVILEKVIVK
ncbi:hypothetical protein BT63DRAFT_423802 [Microthyrium microscopicum]|uniref:N-acetyltransferase domain-containing protein n=1 Tax=Microthyrium microscopicum TaxID=703497 RepID=A0A6A6UEG2_9PEZI|nr:hypothetical protein BT63DRAFT_423802 [Microthyrium microscopicum]